MAIQRVNYHDGLFLEEDEFKLEQNYHMLMRRRINYALFKPGVVYGLGLDYTINDEVNDEVGKLTVLPGMAIDEFKDDEPKSPSYGEILGREIIVTSSHDITDKLSGLSGTVWVTVSYTEAEKAADAKSPTELPARTTEFFNIEVHPNSPGEGTEKILLGSIEIGSPPAVEASQKASLRLGGAAPVSLVSVAVTSASPSVPVGGSVQLTAIGTRSDNSTIDITNTATWTSSDESLAIVDSQGLVTGKADGSDITITAESEDEKIGTVKISVTLGVVLVSIEITPDPIEIIEGYEVELTATGTYDDNSTGNLTSTATWSSTNRAIASFVDPVDRPGVLIGSGTGSAEITAVAQGINVTVNVTISPKMSPPVIKNRSPRRGEPGMGVIIRGENLDGTTVTFDGVESLILPGSGDERINTLVPDVAPNTNGVIRVTNVDDDFAETGFEIQESQP